MFGFDIEKLAIIGVVALVFIGPERLPRVARTVGALLGRAQRYLADVRAEVSREMQLDELRGVRDTVRSAAYAVGSTIQGGIEQTKSDIVGAISSVKSAVDGSDATAPVMTQSSAPAPALNPAKRNKWRRNIASRQSSTPLWYRHARRRRTRVLSAAARVARYRVRDAR